MHQHYIERIQLVLTSGLMVAEIPESADQTMAQLSGGITTAILTMVKEVHKAELDSISFHDRSVIFVPVDELIFVLEISTLLSKEIMDLVKSEFIKKIDFKANDLYTRGQVDVIKSKTKLTEIYQSEWLHNIFESLGFEKSISDAEISTNIMNYENGEIQLLEQTGEDSINSLTQQIIYNFISSNEYSTSNYCGFISSNELNKAFFLVSINEDKIYRNGSIAVNMDRAKILFKLSANLREEFNTILKTGKNYSINDILVSLSKSHDFSEKEFTSSRYNINISDLEKYVKEVDKLLYTSMIGEKIILVGNKDQIKVVISILDVFNTHQNYSVIEWLEGDIVGNHISGMSDMKFNQLIEKGLNIDEYAVLQIANRKISGKYLHSNKFVKKLYQRNKSFTLKNAVNTIKNEMNLVITYAIQYTAYTKYNKTNLLRLLGELKSNIGNNAQFELIQEIATRQNTWLNQIIKQDTDISEDWI